MNKITGEPEWLENFREKSFEAFKKLPLEESQLFTKYTDPSGIDFENFRSDFSESGIPKEFSDSVFVPELYNELKNKGVIFTDMTTATKKYPEMLIDYFPHDWKNKVEAFNSAFFANGVFIYVPADIEIKNPFRKINLEHGKNVSCKNIIIGDINSRFTVLEESYSAKENKIPSLVTNVTDFILKEGCEITFGGVQNFGYSVLNADIKRCFCGNNSKMSWNLGSFGSGLTRSRVDSFMNGPGCMVEDNEIIFGNNSQRFDVMSNLHHLAASTHGISALRGVLKDSSAAVIKGMIKIGKDAKNSRSYLAEHAMLLNKGAKADAIPALEIENNDVKATHSASVAQINEDHMFYLMTRGLDEKSSKKMMVNGFLEAIMQKMPTQSFRNLLMASINSKWNDAENEAADYAEHLESAKTTDIFSGHYKYR